MIQREADLSKQLKGSTCSTTTTTTKTTTAATTASWLGLKDSRVVRVSRDYGGKDRHSKVCTVKGLRDRRVRLSVPTAIQIYDLQDRLGLSQPSKVVDWLLNIAKHDIDDLPPLQIPEGGLETMLDSHSADSKKKQGLKISGANVVAGKAKEESDETLTYVAQNSFQRQMNTFVGPHSPFVRVDPSNLSVFHPWSHEQTSQVEDWHNFSILPLQPALVYQPGMNTQSYFHSQIAHTNTGFNLNQMSSSSSSYVSTQLPISSFTSAAAQLTRPVRLNNEKKEQNNGNI